MKRNATWAAVLLLWCLTSSMQAQDERPVGGEPDSLDVAPELESPETETLAPAPVPEADSLEAVPAAEEVPEPGAVPAAEPAAEEGPAASPATPDDSLEVEPAPAEPVPAETAPVVPDLPAWIDPLASARRQFAQDLLHSAKLAWKGTQPRAAILLLLEIMEMSGDELINERLGAISLFNTVNRHGREQVSEATAIAADEPSVARTMLNHVIDRYLGCVASTRANAALVELFQGSGGTVLMWEQVEEDMELGRYYWAREHLRTLRRLLPKDSGQYVKVVKTLGTLREQHQDELNAQMIEYLVLEARGLQQRESFEDAYRRYDYVTLRFPDHADNGELESRKTNCIQQLAKRGKRYAFVLTNNNRIDGVVLWRRNGQIAVQVENGIVFLDEIDVAEEITQN